MQGKYKGIASWIGGYGKVTGTGQSCAPVMRIINWVVGGEILELEILGCEGGLQLQNLGSSNSS